MEASYGTSQTSNLQPFTKKVNGLQPKTISAKESTLDVWEVPKEYQRLLWWVLPQILTPPLNLKIWCRIPAPVLITHLILQLSYREYRYLKLALKNYWFCRNSRNDTNGRGWGVILFASLWRIAYENRYVAHP